MPAIDDGVRQSSIAGIALASTMPAIDDWRTPSSIAGIVLASADLDHVLGLLLLRELQPLRVYATASVRRILREDNSMFGMLHRIPDQAKWIDLDSGKEFSLCDAQGEDSG